MKRHRATVRLSRHDPPEVALVTEPRSPPLSSGVLLLPGTIPPLRTFVERRRGSVVSRRLPSRMAPPVVSLAGPSHLGFGFHAISSDTTTGCLTPWRLSRAVLVVRCVTRPLRPASKPSATPICAPTASGNGIAGGASSTVRSALMTSSSTLAMVSPKRTKPSAARLRRIPPSLH